MRSVRSFCNPGFAILSAVLAASAPAVARASVTFGTLSNFDVFNDTEQECHGFEIELEGLHKEDVLYTFGAPYQRYGDPVVVEYAGGVYVRYLSPYDDQQQSFVAATPLAPAVITPTDGHACWTGGSGDYLSSGCEHFGVSLLGNPTKTTYRWLVADAQSPGSLKPSGTQVQIPAPIWNVAPPPPELPDQVHPVVAAVIKPPEPKDKPFGDAIWMKIFVTEDPEPAELEHLVSGDDRVPDEPAEVEMEWELIQAEVGKEIESEHSGQIGEGHESVTRRYEFYEYTGAYDPEDHEAKPENDSSPAEGEIGNYIGSQMAAVNLDAGIVTTTTSTTTTSSSSTSTSTSLPAEICGDANDDGEVTSTDALAALRAAVGQPSACNPARCDADGNGMLQSSDALRILRAAVGQPVAMSCPV